MTVVKVYVYCDYVCVEGRRLAHRQQVFLRCRACPGECPPPAPINPQVAFQWAGRREDHAV